MLAAYSAQYTQAVCEFSLVHTVCRQARQDFGANDAGLLAFDHAPSPGLQLAGQLSPLQESSFTPHRCSSPAIS